MRLLWAHLLGFRNIAEARLDFCPGVNLLLGDNGHGKTNLLEALDYPSLGRSFRGAADGELVRFGEPAAHLELAAEDDDGRPMTFAAGIERDGRRRLRLDGETVRRKADLVGRLLTVVYDPTTVELVRGGPRHRRRYLDRALSLTSAEYLAQLRRYRRALRQKSHLLREGRRRRLPLAAVARDLQAWNRELAASGRHLVRERRRLAAETQPLATALHVALTGRRDELQLVYRQGIEVAAFSGAGGDFERDFDAVLDYIMTEEYQRGRCLAGPHLDDLDVRLAGVDLRTYGSQGETRTAAIALQLAQGEFLWRHTGRRPVLMLDDIFSELDADRARRLRELTAAEHQVFAATARREDVAGWEAPALRAWRIRDGEVTPEP